MEASYSADNCAQVPSGLLDPSHINELVEKEHRTSASSCKSSLTVTDAVLGSSLKVLQMGEHQGRGLVVQQTLELRLGLDLNPLQQGADVC